jgi:hypothetical protein
MMMASSTSAYDEERRISNGYTGQGEQRTWGDLRKKKDTRRKRTGEKREIKKKKTRLTKG